MHGRRAIDRRHRRRAALTASKRIRNDRLLAVAVASTPLLRVFEEAQGPAGPDAAPSCRTSSSTITVWKAEEYKLLKMQRNASRTNPHQAGEESRMTTRDSRAVPMKAETREADFETPLLPSNRFRILFAAPSGRETGATSDAWPKSGSRIWRWTSSRANREAAQDYGLRPTLLRGHRLDCRGRSF